MVPGETDTNKPASALDSQSTACSTNPPAHNDPSTQFQHQGLSCTPSSDHINIPRGSFTAFRLLNASVQDVSHLSTTVFLGPIPDAWMDISKSSLLLLSKKNTNSSVRKWVQKASLRMKQVVEVDRNRPDQDRSETSSFDNGSACSSSENGENGVRDSVNDSENDSDVYSDDENEAIFADQLARFRSGGTRSSHSSITRFLPRHDSDESSYESCNESSYAAPNGRLEPPVGHAGQSFTYHVDDTSDLGPETETDAQAGPETRRSNGSAISENQNGPEREVSSAFIPRNEPPQKLFFPAGDNEGMAERPDLAQTPISNPSPQEESLVVHGFTGDETQLAVHGFTGDETQSAVSTSFTFQRDPKSKVSFAEPAPESEAMADLLQREYVRSEKKQRRHMKKLHKFANKASQSTNRAGAKKNRLKLHFVDRILKKHKTGDIIRVDRMLVLIKKSNSVHALSSIGEKYDADFGILDHWREYHVVLKKTGSVEAPLLAQFFEVKKGKDFSAKPEHKLKIRKELMSDFYCHSDKTICIADPTDDGLRLFIMSTRIISVAYKWLYMIKEVLEEEFFSLLKIEVAETDVKFQINIPKKLLRQSFSTAEDLKVLRKDTGYEVIKDELLEYLKEQMTSRIHTISSCHQQLHQWISANPHPWFCFKFYDRVEWVPNSGKALFVQSQLLQKSAALELRSVERTQLSTTQNSDGDDGHLTRPFPVEGFLSRITNTRGEEYSSLRLFYRIQYFHSADNILFFSKILRGVPPSPRNVLLQADPKTVDERTNIRALIPEVYVRNPFELDSNDHLPWLDTPEFSVYDSEAVDEFSRRIQHLACAEAMIDLCNVKSVREIPMEKIHKHHLYLQSYLWYSSPTTLENDEIMDCGFEMELENGSCVKLLAPSRAMKHEWIRRLTDLTKYWRCRAENLLKTQILTKLRNKARFLVDDAVDSNVDFDPQSVEIGRSYANGHLFTNASMAMSTVVLAAGPIYQKQKKHASFVQYYMVLCPGFLVIFSLFSRSKVTGSWRKTPYYERYMTIPIYECYVYAESSTQLDLLESRDGKTPGENVVPRLYSDGWKSTENEAMRSFSLWFGGKRTLRKKIVKNLGIKNPGFVHMARKSGVTGKMLVFQARSRQEREMWVYNILQQVNRAD